MIYCILMAGGKGSRIKKEIKTNIEKPMLKIKNKPLIEYIITSLSKIDNITKIYAAVSKNTPITKKYILDNYFDIVEILETSGEGYSTDYLQIINLFKSNTINNRKLKVLFMPADLPLLLRSTIRQITKIEQEKPCVNIIVEKKIYDSTDLESTFEIEFNKKVCYYTGISMVDLSKINRNTDSKYIREEYKIINNSDLIYNINTLKNFLIVKRIYQNWNTD